MEPELSDPGRGEAKESFIRLDDFLKLTGRVRSGGEAKHRIQGGNVLVNGAVETRRSRKLVRGDKVTLDGVTSEVILGDPAPERPGEPG